MRRRLLLVSLSLMGLLLVALTVPLVTTYASDRSQALFVSRLGDVSRFAVLAEDALESGVSAGLDSDFERYVEVYGGTLLVTNANREVVVRAGDDPVVDVPEAEAAIDRALSGAGPQAPRTIWPWSDDRVVIASPVGRDAQVLGAVVMVAPTDAVRDSISRGLAWLAVVGLLAVLLLVYGAVVPFVGWILRPVHDLEHAAKELAEGDLTSRAHELGPPELRDLARSFNVMAVNVETSQRRQRELVADAAHQLGNPLTALRLRVESLASSSPGRGRAGAGGDRPAQQHRGLPAAPHPGRRAPGRAGAGGRDCAGAPPVRHLGTGVRRAPGGRAGERTGPGHA